MVKDDRIIFRAGHDRKQVIKDLERQGLIKPGYLSEFMREQVDELISHIHSGNGHAIPERTKDKICEYIEKKEKEEALKTLLKAKEIEYFEALNIGYLQQQAIIDGLLAEEKHAIARKILCEVVYCINDEKRAVSPRYADQFLSEQYDKMIVDGRMERIVAERRPWIKTD